MPADDPDLRSFYPGFVVGPYLIGERLGAGGMGEVYRAQDTRLQRPVAIKILKAQFTERFQRESRAISALNHPNICTLYDVGRQDGVSYLVMEHVDGEPIHGPRKVRDALRLAIQIAAALDAAHEKGILHRDLKPGNILVAHGRVKLLDFGLAKIAPPEDRPPDVTATAPLTVAGQIVGTPAYMSPEQVEGKPADARSDIFSFGLVLYELLTGRRAFEGTTQAGVMAAILKDDPPPVGSMPESLQRVVAKCLAKDPAGRWQTASDLRDELEWIAASPSRAGATAGGAEPGARRPWLPWAVASILAVALAVCIWSLAKVPPAVGRPLVRLDVDLGPEAVHAAALETAISPDGARIAFAARASDGQTRLAVRALEGPRLSFLSGTENASSPFFSPDGQWIGFVADVKLKKAPTQGGEVVALADAAGGTWGASWGDDQQIVFVRGFVNPLLRVPSGGGKTETLTRVGERGDGTHRWPQVLPGGHAVLFTSHKIITGFDDAAVEVAAIPGGKIKTLVKSGYSGRYLETPDGGYLLYVHEGALFAVRFDLKSQTAQGTPVPMIDDLAGDSDSGSGQYDVAKNGTLVYRRGSGPPRRWQILWMDSSGNTETLVQEPGAYSCIRLSPDGKRLAMTVDLGDKGREIEVYDIQRGSLTRLTFTGEVNLFPVWSPDGKCLVFEASSPTGYGLGLVRADGSGNLQRLAENNNLMIPHSFSPDGQLVYAANGFVWAAPFDTSDPNHIRLGAPRQLFAGGGSPMVSPNGRWIAYSSFESGRNEVYVQPFPGPGAKFQISTGGYLLGGIAWAPDSRAIYYMGPDNRLMVARCSVEGDTLIASRPEVWSKGPLGLVSDFARQFSLSADGKRFAVFPVRKAPVEGSVHVTFALNFVDELRRRVK